MKIYILFPIVLLLTVTMHAQNDTVKLKEVVVSTNRISLPYFKTSRTINFIVASDMEKATVTNLPDLLQQIAGVDIRRRGVDGTQSDLYIRGGNFDQSLLLIDGFKMEDVQTGHHILNAALPLESINRIEVIKGPAARVFGQNAFAGAVNIVTKNAERDFLNAAVGYGSYNTFKAVVASGFNYVKKNDLQLFINKQKSDGYRYNTDFDNTAVLVKAGIGKIKLLGSLNQHNFGANGFYASPDYKDQYEETQTSLLGISTEFISNNFQIKPKIYWRRNQDMYLFLRNDPDYLRNFHLSNKLAAETNFVLDSRFGKTGFGIDLNKVFLNSSNLGNHNRTTITTFLEHRFLFNDRWDITPGVAMSSYSDFGTHIFPGIDIGYELRPDIKLYANAGYTYRIPTYTDLYYKGPTTQGNPELEPESALAQELGLKYFGEKFSFNAAIFNRNSKNLIDWAKENEADKWQTKNFSKVATYGIEFNGNYRFSINDYPQQLNLNYHYINDEIKDVEVAFTRYSLNSLKHQFNMALTTQFLKFLSQSISMKFVERTLGERYTIINAKVNAKYKRLNLGFYANNIFNTEYTETNLVPMPKANFSVHLTYNIF